MLLGLVAYVGNAFQSLSVVVIGAVLLSEILSLAAGKGGRGADVSVIFVS